MKSWDYPGAMPPTIFERVWKAVKHNERLMSVTLAILEGVFTIIFLVVMAYVLHAEGGFTNNQAGTLVMVVYWIVYFCKKDS